jgi:hypothetical protein
MTCWRIILFSIPVEIKFSRQRLWANLSVANSRSATNTVLKSVSIPGSRSRKPKAQILSSGQVAEAGQELAFWLVGGL